MTRRLTSRRFEWIVSNPPVHRGVAQYFGVLRRLAHGAAARLARGGSVWIVAQEQIPVGLVLESTALYAEVALHRDDGRFCVWRARVATEEEEEEEEKEEGASGDDGVAGSGATEEGGTAKKKKKKGATKAPSKKRKQNPETGTKAEADADDSRDGNSEQAVGEKRKRKRPGNETAKGVVAEPPAEKSKQKKKRKKSVE